MMPSEETLQKEAEVADSFTRDDAKQKDMGVRLDRSRSRCNKGRMQSMVARAADDMDMKSRGRYMVKKKRGRK
jgi:hypothetical protein